MSQYYALEDWNCEGCGENYLSSIPFNFRYFGDDEEEILCGICYRNYQETKI